MRRPRVGMAWCQDCQATRAIHEEDFGVGPYDYGGATGIHHNWQWVCNTCESERILQPVVIHEPEYD